MGDDEMNQFVYKFVSQGKWDPKTKSGAGVSETSGLLDKGTLYVARFNADGSGNWLELAPGLNDIPRKSSPADQEGFDEAEIAIRSRMAAKIAGATPMDRPEWLAVHPETKEVYVTLTNNKSRHATDPANPRAKNIFGHIVRWKEANDDPTSTEFRWQIYVLAGNPQHPDANNQGNIKGDFFACPDGIKFDASGILWIQTDMSSSAIGQPGYVELGHNMMLAANPLTGETRRFLTGPRGCEITGNALTPDRKTMFVNIQHPGEPADDLSDPNMPLKVSSWPDGPSGGRPRSATIAIRKLDGGVIGS
jgi:secreted PhoX family phosphatase